MLLLIARLHKVQRQQSRRMHLVQQSGGRRTKRTRIKINIQIFKKFQKQKIYKKNAVQNEDSHIQVLEFV